LAHALPPGAPEQDAGDAVGRRRWWRRQ
jgi:hypothetical protein